ncbi:23540_t:CDS:2 [Cetraspora pellucida]|uniref:23540_t:CDS:1 n=1 Tax=Cetraspora pellucida TaxID=1433469 RepID=A0A9N9HV83_9GLOM|nr:23540_t:CDS:2 [Cetraspora pellucida]
MFYSLILTGIKLTLKNFIEQHLPISSTNIIINDFDEFLKPVNDDFINKRKGELLEYFIQQFLLKNGILSYINKTFVYFSQGNYQKISDVTPRFSEIQTRGGSGEIQRIRGMRNPKYKVEVDEVRKLLNVISKKPETFIGFLVSNVPLSDYAQKELENSKLKHRICVCYFHEIVDKIFEYAQILDQNQERGEWEMEKRKRKFKELKDENEFLKEENKRLKKESIKELKCRIETLEKKLENQNKEYNEKLNLILKKLS